MVQRGEERSAYGRKELEPGVTCEVVDRSLIGMETDSVAVAMSANTSATVQASLP